MPQGHTTRFAHLKVLHHSPRTLLVLIPSALGLAWLPAALRETDFRRPPPRIHCTLTSMALQASMLAVCTLQANR